MFPKEIYYEPDILEYELGIYLKEKYKDKPWIPIETHNKIDELRTRPNSDFEALKNLLIIGTRKTHKYSPNEKVSDYLVPFTSSGCTARCLYCYLVCNYNKCAYLRLFVNREEMLNRLIRTANKAEKELTFEIGSNSDLILENTFTNNLPWVIEKFSNSEKGRLTFPTKFSAVAPLLPLNHRGRTIFRMSVNPEEIIAQIELGTASLTKRIIALNQMCDAGYPAGLLIAPVIFLPQWEQMYEKLIDRLADELSLKVRQSCFIEVIFMSYSFVHRKINEEAFPDAPMLYSPEQMSGRGRGKYCYKNEWYEKGQEFLRAQLDKKLPEMKILYFS